MPTLRRVFVSKEVRRKDEDAPANLTLPQCQVLKYWPGPPACRPCRRPMSPACCRGRGAMRVVSLVWPRRLRAAARPASARVARRHSVPLPASTGTITEGGTFTAGTFPCQWTIRRDYPTRLSESSRRFWKGKLRPGARPSLPQRQRPPPSKRHGAEYQVRDPTEHFPPVIFKFGVRGRHGVAACCSLSVTLAVRARRPRVDDRDSTRICRNSVAPQAARDHWHLRVGSSLSEPSRCGRPLSE